MIRVRRVIEFLGVAREAVCRQCGEVVIHVAGCTRNSDMRTRQREGRLGVIERRGTPRHCRVANGAVRRETGCRVIRVRRLIEIIDVARGASSGCTRIDIVYMALGAGDRRVSAGEGERGLAMIEDRPRPGNGRMAACAGRRKTCGLMVWICRAIEI